MGAPEGPQSVQNCQKRPFWAISGSGGSKLVEQSETRVEQVRAHPLCIGTVLGVREGHMGVPEGLQRGPKLPKTAFLGHMRIWWLQGPPKGTPDPRNGSNASPGMCPDLFHPCSTLFHQFGATRLAYGPKRPFLAVLDPVWPYNWPKWLEQEWSLVEQVNPYQNEAENIMGCHGKPTSKNP